MSDLVTVDDLDFSAIDYFDTSTISWNYYQPPNDPNVWDAEVRLADGPGVSAVFKFTGSQVSVFGRVQPSNGSSQPLSLYSVGDQKLQAFIPEQVTEAVDNVAFFNSTVMPYGAYTLIINVSQASSNAPYMLDYIRYNTSDPQLGTQGITSVSTSATTSSSSPASSATGSTSGSSSSSSSSPVGAIVGGVVGGLAVLAALVFGLCFYNRRRRRTALPEIVPSSASITPYVVANSTTPGPGDPPPPTRQLNGSTYSLISTHPGGVSAISEKNAARSFHTLPAPTPSRPSEKGSHSRSPSPGPRSAFGDSSSSAGPDAAVISALTTAAASSTHALHSSRPGTPLQHSSTAAPPAQVQPARPRAHPKASRAEAASPPPLHAQSASQQDSGMRFQPGLTPSNVAPVLPAGVAPPRQAATFSEVARADIPPAYTPD